MTVEIPAKMRNLPLDKHHRPVPWFAHWADGVPDHRVVKPDATRDALRFKRCWVCGGCPMGRFGAFVIGPMCAVNRVSAEPPSHRECATYSALACPFLTTPNMHRRENDIPEDAAAPAGIMLKRNPGVTLVWISRSWSPFRAPDGGVLVDIGDPDSVAWYCAGRPATREEILASVQTGLPNLQRVAAEDGPDAEAELQRRLDIAMTLVPA